MSAHLRICSRIFIALLATSQAPAALDDHDAALHIAGLKSLSAADREMLLTKLDPKTLRKLPAAEHEAIQMAALRFSESAIGRRPNGRLIEVTDLTEKRLLQIAGEYLSSLPPEKVTAHPKAGDLFGKISPGAARISRQVTIDPKSERWHTTGLYAAPGEVVVVTVPEPWRNRGLKVRISGHTDRIPLKNKLVRLPEPPSRSFAVTGAETLLASAFGGAVYIDTGTKPIQEPPFSVSISNAVAAPGFKLGSTSPDLWRSSLKSAPAPYAELMSDRVILSIPSEWIRELDDPTALVAYWDHIVGLHDELGGLSRIRTCPERVNVDVQISAGLFHAGYPMQGPQQACRGVVDLTALREQGNWGWFHELGHEAQRRPDKAWSWNNPYTFDSSIEVTVNLFSSHAYNRLGISPKGGWAWTVDPKQVAEKARKASSAGTPYAKADVATKLTMYLQLRDAFGWESIAAVLKSYSDDQSTDPKRLPEGEQAERDDFLVRMSSQVKHDLYPFFHGVWGLELGEDARQKVAGLKPWLPDGFTVR